MDALESGFGRWVLGETPTGRSIMHSAPGERSFDRVDDFLAHLKDPAYQLQARSLDDQIAQLRAELRSAEAEMSGGSKDLPSDAAVFAPTAIESEFLKQVVTKRIRWKTAPGAHGPLASEQAMLNAGEGRGSLAVRARRLSRGTEASHAAPVEPWENRLLRTRSRPGEEAPPSIQEAAKRSFKEWWKDTGKCLADRPVSSANANRLKNLAQQLPIAAAVTTGGVVGSAIVEATTAHGSIGYARVELGDLGLSLVKSLISAGVSVGIHNEKNSVLVRWLKVEGWGLTRATIDAELYELSPWTNTHGMDLREAKLVQRTFDYKWNTATSWVQPTLFRILDGLECDVLKIKGPEAAAKVAKRGFYVKTGVASVNSVIYYSMRPSPPN